MYLPHKFAIKRKVFFRHIINYLDKCQLWNTKIHFFVLLFDNSHLLDNKKLPRYFYELVNSS